MVSDVLRKAHTSLGGNGFVKEKLKTTAVVASMSLSQDETSGGDRLVCPTEDGAKANDCILKVETFNNWKPIHIFILISTLHSNC